MRKFILISIAAVLLPSLQTVGRGLRWGIEWETLGTFHANTSCIYTAEEGYIVDYRKNSSRLHVNGSLECYVGLDFAKRLNISLYTGYAGIADGERGVPVSLRPTLHFGRTPAARGASIFVEGGLFFRKKADVSIFAKIGTGWRTRLSDHLALDFNIGLQMSGTHPDIYDKYSGKYLRNDAVRELKCVNEGFFLSTALVF